MERNLPQKEKEVKLLIALMKMTANLKNQRNLVLQSQNLKNTRLLINQRKAKKLTDL